MKKADVDRMVECMTTNRLREQTRQLAEQAGFVVWDGAIDWSCNYDDELEKFAELVRAEEREACAKLAEDGLIGHTIAKAIRARGEK